MKEYMVVYLVDGETGAAFADTWDEAQNKRIDVECGLGGYAEIYGRDSHEDTDQPDEYVLICC